MTNKVIIRKPTDEEQREAKIVTSDYAISAVTIHSSVLYHLGLLDKVYRSKETTISPSNKKAVKTLITKLNSYIKYFPTSFTIHDVMNFDKMCSDVDDLIDMFKISAPKSWKLFSEAPKFMKQFNTPSSFLRAEKYCRQSNQILSSDLLDGMSDYINDETLIFGDFVNIAIPYLNSITHDAIKKHTQTHIWETAYRNQLKIEEELGQGFTPRDLAHTLDLSSLTSIKMLWNIELLNYKGSWQDLCNYLYSPTILAAIRNSLGVNVRARSSTETRKGVEAIDKKRYENAIKRYEERLGCRAADFSVENEQQKIETMKDELSILEVKYSEGLMAKSHSKASNNEETKSISEACETMRNRINYLKKSISNAESSLPKKIEAWKTIVNYEKKHDDLMNFINETRPWEEVALIEQNALQDAINRQRDEKQIPYYTWRFICSDMNETTANSIESALEENLNKGCGVNGEDGYINVTSFQISCGREFFVDYPKSSNLYKAFKHRGKELSDILINGVAKHLGIRFAIHKGETYFNSKMEKTMSGDMFEWVGV